MFDFKKEVNRFKPMTEVNDLENIMLENEMQDIVELLRLSKDDKKHDRDGKDAKKGDKRK
ncbi:MAG: hypothetical protein IJR45_00840 [Firmicutes bacterium]|nr:hypothetical protein [Bacillota bacterium]MBQ9603937.1 hypothetical protein [Bacillota bacterium]